VVLVGVVGILVTAKILSRRFEPYIREQAIAYMSQRFDSEVQLDSLSVEMPKLSPLQLLMERRGLIRVSGAGISMRHKGRRDVPPMFAMKKFSFEVDLGVLFEPKKTVQLVTLEGMEINIPPKGERPSFDSDGDSSAPSGVNIERVEVTDATLTILPKRIDRKPLRFDIHQLTLESTSDEVGMKYDASLTNAKPPGEILSEGHIGRWVAEEPGDTPLDGKYSFDNADLGVFSSIAGILDSTGEFEGTLSEINVVGEASVPDFRLRLSDNAVPLHTKFEVMVDGTNGDTILKPVVARLGTTDFTTSGAVIKNEGEDKRTISLDVLMPAGNLGDVLRLAMKGAPFMEGKITLKTSIDIPPLEGKVREKLRLNGNFQVKEARFLTGSVQDKVDTLSRRGQGDPKNEEIDNVVSGMKGVFDLENEVITFKSLSFGVPGAVVDLTGNYHFGQEIDFHGTLKLDAKVSQTMSGWKRWLLKPVDPFFAKNGAGTFIRIKVDGTADEPKFGRDTGDKDKKDAEDNKKAGDKKD
jgi:hypothetical protein